MGAVFLGENAAGEQAAIKVIRPELAGDPDFRARFAREIAAGQRVQSRFTARVLAADAEAPSPWFAAEFIEGPTLADYVASHGPLPGHLLIGLAIALAEAIVAIHASGVVHRDLKPGNVVLSPVGPKVVDFGIARAFDATAITQSGGLLGSPAFMAPEQAEGKEVGPAADVFSLGATITYAGTGLSPFGSGTPAAVVYRVVHAEPDLSGLDEPLAEVVRRTLAKDPANRPTSTMLLDELNGGEVTQPAVAVQTLLETKWADGPPSPNPIRRRRGRVFALAGAAAVILLVGLIGAILVLARSDQGSKAATRHPLITAAEPSDTPIRGTVPSSPSLPKAPWATKPVAPPAELQDVARSYYQAAGPHPKAAGVDAPSCLLMLPTGITQSHGNLEPAPSTINFGGSSGDGAFTAVWESVERPDENVTLSIHPRDDQSVNDYFAPDVQVQRFRGGSEERFAPNRFRSALIVVPGQDCYYEVSSSENVAAVDDRIFGSSLRLISPSSV